VDGGVVGRMGRGRAAGKALVVADVKEGGARPGKHDRDEVGDTRA
jgi:hypothetical protein